MWVELYLLLCVRVSKTFLTVEEEQIPNVEKLSTKR